MLDQSCLQDTEGKPRCRLNNGEKSRKNGEKSREKEEKAETVRPGSYRANVYLKARITLSAISLRALRDRFLDKEAYQTGH